MRGELIEDMKLEIEARLKTYLQSEGIDLYVAANDNVAKGTPLIELEAIDDVVLSGDRLLFEIKVVLGLLDQPWEYAALVNGIYHALHPHNIRLSELTVLLMSIHIEPPLRDKGGIKRKRTVMRYIVEEC